jgi:signal transduction histidine kinase
MADYLSVKLRYYQVGLPVLFSLIAGILMGVSSLYQTNDESKALLKSLAPHVALLVETNDRPELQRLISSMSDESGTQLEIAHNGIVIASSRTRENIGLKSETEVSKAILPNRIGHALVTSVAVRRPGGAAIDGTLSRFVPISSVVNTVAATMLLIFFASLIMTWILASKIGSVARKSVEPIQTLDSAIRSLSGESLLVIQPFKIRELESIRCTVLETNRQLRSTTAALTEARAHELANESVKRLMHDLHTPVTALRQWIKLSMNPKLTESERSEAREKVVDLAEQILAQVGAGKSNLGVLMTLNTFADLANTITVSVERTALALSENFNVEILTEIPRNLVPYAHDPEMLERVVSNLVTNAAEASAKRIIVELELKDDMPHIRVSDNGPGMSQEVVALHLVGRGKSSKGERVGLGLSNCNHIIRSHGGKLIHRRSKDGGSEFEIRLKSTDNGVVL